MKKNICAIITACLFISCGGGSSSDSTAEYKLKPGDLTVSTDPKTLESYNVTYSGTPYNQSNAYAVMYKQTINGVDYVGIAACQDGDPFKKAGGGFNIKITFQASSIPASVTLTRDVTAGFGIKLTIDNADYTLSGGDDSIILNFSGPDSNNVYTITGDSGNNTISVGGNNLTITQIKARYVTVSQ
jgi:hypothetical protein